tara:strand:+ start:105 stop:428 length:324 start_codon:yes stop_codon:yes gene_type:complete
MKNKIKLLVFLLIFLNSCQSVKDGLTGKKRNNSDEFLVEKKNPLELPPDFDKLPVPKKDEENINKSEKIDEEIESLFENSTDVEEVDNSTNTSSSAEEFVLKKINRN